MFPIDTVNSWISLILGILAIISAVGGFLLWLHHRFTNFLKSEILDLAKEFRPNGGSSLKDQVNRLEKQHSTLNQKVDEIYDLLTSPTKPIKITKTKS
jgi:uncharacterized iron-regulated membrane protein